jgi:uncharacterized protein
MNIKKKIALVTGASSGLGREFTIQIAQKYDFDEIWIFARRAEKLTELAQKINSEQHKELVKPVSLDLSGKEGVKALKNYLDLNAPKDSVTVGLLVNNAGYGTYGPFDQVSLTAQMNMIELNCTTLTGICGIIMPYLEKNSVIINTASLAGFMPLGNFAVYAATKAYALNFTIALAAELKDKGIKVHALCPGSVSTEFANVASAGVRPVVKGGKDPVKVVAHCLKRAFKGKKISLWAFKWKFNAFLSRIAGRYTVARITYKTNPRPRKSEESIDL